MNLKRYTIKEYERSLTSMVEGKRAGELAVSPNLSFLKKISGIERMIWKGRRLTFYRCRYTALQKSKLH